MNKRKSLLVLFSVFLLIGTVSASIDGFEDGDYTSDPAWEVEFGTPSNYQVTEDAALNGTYGLELNDIGTERHRLAYSSDISEGERITGWYNIQDGDLANLDPGVGIFADGSWGTHIRIGSNGNLVINGDSCTNIDTGVEYTQGEWIKLGIENEGGSTQRYLAWDNDGNNILDTTRDCADWSENIGVNTVAYAETDPFTGTIYHDDIAYEGYDPSATTQISNLNIDSPNDGETFTYEQTSNGIQVEWSWDNPDSLDTTSEVLVNGNTEYLSSTSGTSDSTTISEEAFNLGESNTITVETDDGDTLLSESISVITEDSFTLDVPDSSPIENEPYTNTEVPFSVSVIDGQLNNDYQFEFYNNGELVHDETVTKTSEGTIGPTESIEFSDYDEGKNTVNYTVTDLETGETETEERDYFGYNHETTIELSPPEGSILPPGDIETEANLETDWDYDLSITHSSGGVEDSVIDQQYSRTGPVDETFTLSQEFTDTTQSYFNELSVSFVVDEEDINTNTVDFTSEYNEFDIGEEAEVDIEWDWDYSTNDFSSNADSFWGPSTGVDGYEVLFGSAQTHEDGLVEGLDFRTATITIDNVPDSIDVQNPEFDLWLSDGEGNQFASPIYRGVDDSSQDLTLINETTNEADSFSRSAMISQLRESNFNDTFTVSDFQRTMEVGDGEDDPVVYTIPIPNEINRQHMGTNYSSPFDGTPESVSYELYMDMNEEWTEDYTGELVLNAEIEDEVHTGSIYFSNNIVFDNFRSSSSVSTKDTTLRFNVDKDISEFEQARVRVSQSVDDALRYDSEDEVGETIDVTNIANRPLIISRGDSPVTTWLEPLDSGDEIEVTVPPSYRGVSSDEFVSTLSTRTQLFERENISEEVEIDGSELDRGEFNAEFFFEDNMSRSGTQDGVEYGDSGNIDSFDRTFTIRENTIVGSFYQMFDNFLQWDDWVTGLLLFLVISLGGMLLIDLKLSFMLGLAYGLTVSIALLFTGILPLQINLLIVIMLGIIVTIIGRRIFS